MPKSLSDIMEFDHVIQVLDNGEIIGRNDLFAPELFEEYIPDGWELLNGYSGQYGYSGPIMHSSEIIGGQMEKDIRETPGIYVAIVSYGESFDYTTGYDTIEPAGWAIARKVN